MFGKQIEQADAIVVLGAGVTKKNNLPKIAKSRMDKAIELHTKRVAQRIIVAGKKEAGVMKRYAVLKSLSPSQLIKEPKSIDTISNALFTRKDILEPNNWRSIVVVTSDFHVPRAKFIFKKVLGKKYRIGFVAAKCKLPKTQRKKIFALERALTILTRLLGTLVRDGDLEAVEHFLRKSPLYVLYKRTSNLS